MNVLKDKKILILGAILIVFSIGYFIIANKISYAFETGNDPDADYDSIIETIEEVATFYGKNHPELFQNETIARIKVQDLIDNNLLMTNEEGNIVDPLNKDKTLNYNGITIKSDNGEITVEVDRS